MKTVEFKHKTQTKLIGIEEEETIHQETTSNGAKQLYKRTLQLSTPKGVKIVSVEDKSKTLDGCLLESISTKVKCYEKYFMLERHTIQLMMGKYKSFYSYFAYDYRGHLIGKSLNCIKPEKTVVIESAPEEIESK